MTSKRRLRITQRFIYILLWSHQRVIIIGLQIQITDLCSLFQAPKPTMGTAKIKRAANGGMVSPLLRSLEEVLFSRSLLASFKLHFYMNLV